MTSENNITVGGVVFGPKSSKVLNVQLPSEEKLRDFYHMTLGCGKCISLAMWYVCMRTKEIDSWYIQRECSNIMVAQQCWDFHPCTTARVLLLNAY